MRGVLFAALEPHDAQAKLISKFAALLGSEDEEGGGVAVSLSCGRMNDAHGSEIVLDGASAAWIKDMGVLYAVGDEILAINPAGGNGLVFEEECLSGCAKRCGGCLDANTPFTAGEDFAADFEEEMVSELLGDFVQGPTFGDGADVDTELRDVFAQCGRIAAHMKMLPTAVGFGRSDLGFGGR